MAKRGKLVFTWLDLLAPWAICLGSAALCAYAALKGTPLGGDPTAAKIIAWVVGAAFLAGIPLWYLIRGRKRTPDFTTSHGIHVVLGKKHRPTKARIEEWTESLITHWIKVHWHRGSSKVTLSVHNVKQALDGVTVFFADKEKLSVWGRFVRGYSWGKDIVIGMKPLNFDDPVGGFEYQKGFRFDVGYTKSLYRHEASHPVLGFNGEPWDEKRHHAVFKTTELGA
jgi:hypothetical protein